MKRNLLMLFLILIVAVLNSVSVFSENSLDPSLWARTSVYEAMEKGLVSEKILNNDYTENITREEFCKLCVSVMKAWNSDFNYKNENISFSDTNDDDILTCAKMGIVNGVGNNKFAPDNPIKRQEAARMLYNILSVGTSVISDSHTSDGALECCVPHSFNDGGSIRSWARNEINHMYRYGVMLGVSNNNYDPDGYYTKEQAICTFLRLFRCKDSMLENPIPEVDYYPYDDTAKNYVKNKNVLVFDGENPYGRYIDSRGNIYTHKEKGYAYPFENKYGVKRTFTYSGEEVYASELIDKNGDTYLCDNFKSVDIYDSAILLNGLQPCIYGIPREGEDIYDKLIYKAIFFGYNNYGGEYIEYMGDGLFKISKYGQRPDFGDTKDNYNYWSGISIVNSEGEWFTNYNKLKKSEMYVKAGRSYNNIFTMEKADGSISIVDVEKPNGEVIKTFNKPDSSWEFRNAVGSNINFYDRKNDKYIFYRGISGEYFVYDYVQLTDNNEAIVRTNVLRGGEKDFDCYILNPDGTMKFNAPFGGYGTVEKIPEFDFYKAFKYNDDSGLCDIVNKRGFVIKTDVSKNLSIDKSGVFAYVTNENVINFFDFFGDNLGKVELSDIYGADLKVNRIDFINGMLFVDTNLKNFYVTPYGKIL